MSMIEMIRAEVVYCPDNRPLPDDIQEKASQFNARHFESFFQIVDSSNEKEELVKICVAVIEISKNTFRFLDIGTKPSDQSATVTFEWYINHKKSCFKAEFKLCCKGMSDVSSVKAVLERTLQLQLQLQLETLQCNDLMSDLKITM